MLSARGLRIEWIPEVDVRMGVMLLQCSILWMLISVHSEGRCWKQLGIESLANIKPNWRNKAWMTRSNQ